MAEDRRPTRDVIGASWQRSAGAGLTPERFDVPYAADDMDTKGQLASTAAPVLGQLADDLDETSVSVVLTDDRGHLLDRRVTDRRLRTRLDGISLAPGFVYSEHAVGTNAIGTALEQRAPAIVVGEEHFAEALTTMACAAAPIIDPRSGRVLGAVDLSCRAHDAQELMLPLARRTAREIEMRLIDDHRVAERVALRQFLRARRGAKGPLVYVNDETMITNAAADRLLGISDEAVLREAASRLLSGGQVVDSGLTLTGGTPVRVHLEPVLDGGATLGALLRLRPLQGSPASHGSPSAARPGWGSLTDTERSVTALVSQGLTNVQVAEHLFMSRYTVDSHLRAIFRKLDVPSRVELTRLVVERENEAPPG